MTTLKALPQLLRSAMRRRGVPGASLAVYRNGRVTEVAAGVVNLETRVPTTPDTLFQIGSITKIFTTTLIMQLVDEGRVELDTPLKAYVPDFTTGDATASRAATLRHFLSHSSGIEGDLFVDSGRGDDSITRLKDMGRLLPQLFEPGERLSYCNFGFAMLGHLLERLEGSTWDRQMKKKLFDPLRMSHALTLPDDTLRFRCAMGHLPNPKKSGELMVSPMPWLSHGQKAAGATPMMSAGDLMKFVAMHLDGGVSKSGERLLSRSSVRAMQRKQIPLNAGLRPGLNGWGLGWFLGTWSGKKVFGHDGGTIGQSAFLRILPEQQLAVALLTNGGDTLGLYEDIFAETFCRYGRVTLPSSPEPLATPPRDGDRVLGCYENLTGTVELTRRKDRYQVEIRPRPGMLAGITVTRQPAVFLNRNLLRLDSGDKLLDRTQLSFEGNDDVRPDFVGMGGRLYRRVPMGG